MWYFCSHFSSFPRYCQTLITGKGIGHVYKSGQPNCPYPYPNTTFVITPPSSLSSQPDSTNDFGVTLIANNQPLPVSNITTTNQVDTDINDDDYSQYFTSPRKHKHVTPKIRDKNNETIQVHPKVHPLP